MKSLSIVIFLIFWSLPICFSQAGDNDTIHLDKIPAEGILLDKGWRFHEGDDSAWTNPAFDDKDWQPINPSLDIRHIPQIQNVPVFWLRLKLQVDSSLMDQPLGITLSQVGASEIYLDGRLLYKFGTVSAENKKEHTKYLLNRPFSIKLGSNKIQTIAVRYSYEPKGFLVKYGNDNSCLHIELNRVDLTFSNNQKQTRNTFIRELTMAALRLMLVFICFGLYFSFRAQKAYLYIGIRSFLTLSGGILLGLISRELTNTTLVCTILFIAFAINELSSLIGLHGVYLLYNQNKTWVYSALILFAFFSLASILLFYDHGANIYGIYYMLYSLELARLNLVAIRNNRPGAIILFISTVLFFFFIACTFIAANYYSLNAGYLFVFLAVMVEPFAWSLFMVGEYARTGIALQARVKEVEDLSQKAIAQEQEKQQLLANQNEMLEFKVSERTSQLNESIINLKSTQAQLVQSEKMASLGELTAGIAHEIQNPLNFINNFSEVNKELLFEIKEEIDKEKFSEVKAIANDVIENEEKINQHGKRVDAIVKSMLQHSKSSTGQKEPTDINVLIDEYLRLAYHGIRAKEKSFNAVIETDYDQTIGNINIIQQDIGRVLLNLYNNSFYAISEKKKRFLEGYEPTVSVSTKKENSHVKIRVNDNGNGIPQKVLNKIFQPFFTTKPTGQGTGLGLSLSYDIIKDQGGEIWVETKEGEYTEFIIRLDL
jgi:two-component system, NtrC family, sensor kinase